MMLQRSPLGAALAVALFLFAPTAVSGEEAGEGSRPGWGGELELGLIATSGNTRTQSFNANVAMQDQDFPWRHELRIEALHASEQDITVAERYMAFVKTDYRFDERRYMFGTLRYEDDRFSGYDYRVSESLGYGHRVVASDVLNLDLEFGLGGRHLIPLEGEREDEPIVRGAANLGWQVNPTVRLSERLFFESGEENTYTESETGLRLKINSRMATKFSYTVRHNSDVPEGWENTDTTTAVTLVFDF